MKTTTAIASLLAAAACVSASSSSSPVLAFTSKQASSTKLLTTDASYTGLIDSLFAAGKDSPACNLDAITLVRADNLDRNTFSGLRHSSTNSLRARSLDAPSQVTFNVAPGSISDTYLEEQFSNACGHRGHYQITTMPDFGKFESNKYIPNLVYIHANDLRREEPLLLETLASIDETHPRNLVIIASNGRLHQHTKRQYVAEPFASSVSGNWTEPEGGIFARYQLFSTPLILTLVLVGGVLLPIVYFAVSQLAQVQTPDQMGVRKDPISGDKKTQ